ncbi:MAG TPA: Holliday junction resolvase RuvX [Beijerinckiaceae bacterium]|nr:Holliday junction resolvase RuvX [Beijerinckiaceae bacterium]
MAGAVIPLEELAPRLERGGRLLGLDLGSKTIGLALSDVEYRIATALRTLERGKFRDDAAALARIVDEFGIVALVLGLPLNMDGSSGPRVQATRAFARNLLPLLPLPIVLWDERLSTAAAERVLISADLSRTKRAAVIDATAAAYILQGALDRLARIDPHQASGGLG